MNELQIINNRMLQSYIDYLDTSPATVKAYSGAVKQFAKYIRDRGITQPTRETVIEYREHLKTYCKPSTVQNYIEALKIFFQWTAVSGLYPNIADHVKGAKISGEFKKDYLTAKQLRKVLKGIDRDTEKGLRDYAIIVSMITGSLRTIEIVRANIEDLGNAAGSPVLYLQGKGREDRAEYVKIPEPTERAIRDYLRVRKAPDVKEPLFVSVSNHNHGKRLTTRSISRLVKHYLVKAGFDSSRLTAHSIRHSGITLSLKAGNSLQETQQYARHRSMNTTLKYAHNLNRAESKVSQSIADQVFKGDKH